MKKLIIIGLFVAITGNIIGQKVTGVTKDYVSQMVSDSIANMKVGIFNVLNYGAVADTSVNSTIAIQACVDTAKNGTVIIPGFFRIDSLLITNAVTLIGYGSGGSGNIANTSGFYSRSGFHIIKVDFSETLGDTNWIGGAIKNLSILGNNHADVGDEMQTGILIDGESNFHVEGCHIKNCGDYGIRLCQNYHTDKVFIEKNLIEQNKKGGIYGRFWSDEQQLNAIRIKDNEFYYNQGYGINVTGNDILIEGNIIQGNDSAGIYLNAVDVGASSTSRGMTIRSNYLEANDGGDIYAQTYNSGTGQANYHFNLTIEENFSIFNIAAPGKRSYVTAPLMFSEVPGSSTHSGFVDLVVRKNAFKIVGSEVGVYLIDGGGCLDYRATIELIYLVGDSITEEGQYKDIGGANLIVEGQYYPVPHAKTVTVAGIPADALYPIIEIHMDDPIDITANPQIGDGFDGQTIIIKGCSDYATLTLDDGDGLNLSAQCVLGINDFITLQYDEDADEWCEVSRSDN